MPWTDAVSVELLQTADGFFFLSSCSGDLNLKQKSAH